MIQGRRSPIPTQFSTSWRPPISVPGAGQASSGHVNAVSGTFKQGTTADFLAVNQDARDYNRNLELADSAAKAAREQQSVGNYYKLAAEQTRTAGLVEGYATEKQRRDYAWKRRANPLDFQRREQSEQQALDRFRLPSQRGVQGPQPPTSRPNYQGPSRRFGV